VVVYFVVISVVWISFRVVIRILSCDSNPSILLFCLVCLVVVARLVLSGFVPGLCPSLFCLSCCSNPFTVCLMQFPVFCYFWSFFV